MNLLRWTDPLAEANCYLLGENGAALVIDPCEPAGPIEKLEQKGWTPTFILLTHEHCDHTAGLEAMRRRYPDATVASSAACSEGIQSKRLNMSGMMEVFLTFRGKPGISYPSFTCRPAGLTFAGRHELLWQGHRLACVSLPGHTPGSIGIFLDDTSFFSGDYLLPGETEQLRLPGGDAQAYARVTKPFLDGLTPGLRIYPGHGAPFILQRKNR